MFPSIFMPVGLTASQDSADDRGKPILIRFVFHKILKLQEKFIYLAFKSIKLILSNDIIILICLTDSRRQ